LKGATITFYDSENGAASSVVDADGKYEVTKVRTGTAKIAVAVPLAIHFVGPSLHGGGPAPPPPQPKNLEIPPHYHDRERSGLTLEVIKGDQVHNIDLQP